MSASAGKPAVSIRGLQKALHGSDRSFSIEVEGLDLARGEVVVLTGASGSGKSTLLEVIGLASRPDQVAEFFFGTSDGQVDVAELFARNDRAALAKLRAHKLGFVLQTGGLLPFLTVLENILVAQRLAGRPHQKGAESLLEALGLVGLENSLPRHLSVGQRQRAAVARALAHRPALLLADEPTASLDPGNKAQTAALILEVAAQFGSAVLVATHEHQVFAPGAARTLTIHTEALPGEVRARVVGAV